MERYVGQEVIDSDIANACMDEDSTMVVDSNHIEVKVVKVVKVLSFTASQGSQSFIIGKLLIMKKICYKLTRIGVAYWTSTKQCDIMSFFLPSIRP